MIQLNTSSKSSLGKKAKLCCDELIKLSQNMVLATRFYTRTSRSSYLSWDKLHDCGSSLEPTGSCPNYRSDNMVASHLIALVLYIPSISGGSA